MKKTSKPVLKRRIYTVCTVMYFVLLVIASCVPDPSGVILSSVLALLFIPGFYSIYRASREKGKLVVRKEQILALVIMCVNIILILVLK